MNIDHYEPLILCHGYGLEGGRASPMAISYYTSVSYDLFFSFFQYNSCMFLLTKY
jgi:hypothetical protein